MPDGHGKAAGDGGCRGYGTAGKMCQSEKNNDTAVNEIRVIMSEEVEELSG